MKVVIDFDEANEDSLRKALRKVFNVEGDLENIFKSLSYSFDLRLTALPMPKDSRILRELKGFRIDLRKSCEDRVIELLARYCKPIEDFTVGDVYECEGIRIILSDDLEDLLVLETNVDDTTGEVLAYAMEEILKDAVDAYIFTCIGKKGRPCFMLKVLSDERKAMDIAKKMCRELPTLGVRIYKVKRYKVDRKTIEKTVELFGKEFKLRVKVSKVSIKPEFEDVKRIAKELNKPLPLVYREIVRRLNHEDSNGQ
ncbi:nickel insertion protein [Archaeoglobus profundus]|nr:nickel insertion protein [Archaeoglobus profundus]